VVSQHGRPDDGTDATGFFNAEFFAPLKPAAQWPAGEDKDVLTAKLLAQLQEKFPGVEFNFSQYLQDNVSEAVSGVKGENSIKLYGNDLQALTTTARLEKLRRAGTPVTEAFYHLLKFNKLFDERKYGWEGGPLHDASVTAYLLAPQIFSGKRVHIEVECSSPLTLGMTVVDWWGVTGKTPNVLFLRDINADAYFDLLDGLH